jgi:AraC-like DNA-binding protein/mannose-6-phosphate isomerase-like protein (cupin superfamily)
MRQVRSAARTNPRPTRADAFQNVPRPVGALARDLPRSYEIAWHSHPRFQLIYAVRGVMTVDTKEATWVVPPQRAVWMPPATEHRILTSSEVQLRTLYIRANAVARMPGHCLVLEVTPLLRELILRATELPVEYDQRGSAGRVMRLLLDELESLPQLPYNLPMPKTAPLAALCEHLVQAPNDAATLAEIAEREGLSARTLARYFRRQTGMSFAQWRRRARLLRALSWIAEGRPILSVALDLGYESPSAFSAMFRRELGAPPSRFRGAGA